jgi:hypothetical protein
MTTKLHSAVEHSSLKFNAVLTIAQAIAAALQKAGGTMTGDLSVGGHDLSNFKSGGSAADLALAGATPVPTTAAFPAVTIAGLAASKKYQATFGFRVGWYLDSNHASNWSGDIVIDASVVTDGSAVATVTFNTTPYFDAIRFATAGAGCTATVAASAGGFTVSATGITGASGASTDSHAWYEYWIMKYRDVT